MTQLVNAFPTMSLRSAGDLWRLPGRMEWSKPCRAAASDGVRSLAGQVSVQGKAVVGQAAMKHER